MQKFILSPDKHVGWERDGKSTRPLHDAKAIGALMAFARDFKPDLWIEGGDNLDCGAVSHWLKDRHLSAKDLNLQRDLDAYDALVLQPLKQLKSLKRKVWMKGNHEDWLDQLAEREPGLADLLQVDTLLDLDDWDIVERGGVVSAGKLHFIHGDTLPNSKNMAERAVISYEHSIRFGHFHTYQVASKYGQLDGDVKTGVSVPGLCRRNPNYLKNRPNQWSQGFCWGYIHPDGTFNDYVAIITKGRFTIHGQTYT